MSSFIEAITQKIKDAPYNVLFLSSLGGILIIVGTAQSIDFFKLKIVVIDELRLLIIGMGVVFILASIVSTFIKNNPVEQSINVSTTPPLLPLVPFYTFHGLGDELRTDGIFQNFEIDRVVGINRNAVYFMWADTFKHNTIQASVERNYNNDESFLRIIFNNKGGWLSNIAIHPISEQALDNKSNINNKLKNRFLRILARVPRDIQKPLEKVSITLRVCDKNLTYWEYSNKPGEFIQLPILIDGWQEQHADLEDSRLWHKFESDGNYKNTEMPDFSVVSGVVLILGGFNPEEQTPTNGEGIVDIKKISLINAPIR